MIPHSVTWVDSDLPPLFVNSMGKYPRGTMMLLGDGSIAVSIGVCRSEKTFSKRLVRNAPDATGNELDEYSVFVLAEGGEVPLVSNSCFESLKHAEDMQI